MSGAECKVASISHKAETHVQIASRKEVGGFLNINISGEYPFFSKRLLDDLAMLICID